MTSDIPAIGERRVLRLVGWAGPAEPPADFPIRPDDPYLIQEWQGDQWVDVGHVKSWEAGKRLLSNE